MSKAIQINKLKRIMYASLRWRLQLPNYVPHNPLPSRYDPRLSEFTRGVMCAYADLLDEIDKIEDTPNQTRVWNKRWGISVEDSYIDEMRWGRESKNE